jgi:hypothetical protein
LSSIGSTIRAGTASTVNGPMCRAIQIQRRPEASGMQLAFAAAAWNEVLAPGDEQRARTL